MGNISHMIDSLRKLYETIASTTCAFKQTTGLDCVPGCGHCCNRFEPYITILEGLILAEYLQKNDAARQNFCTFPRDYVIGEVLCPFYIKDTDYHCGVYEIRPLICRLYSFTGKVEENGEISFQPCPQIQSYFPKETALAHELLKQNAVSLSIYLDMYAQLCAIDFILATDFHPLSRSIELALEFWDDIALGKYQERQKEIPPGRIIPFASFLRNHLTNNGFLLKYLTKSPLER